MAGEFGFRKDTGDDSLPYVHEPAQATPVGDADGEPFGIFLGSTAADEIEKALSEHPDNPVAGLLIGIPCEGPRRPFLLVTGAATIDAPLGNDGVPSFTGDLAHKAREALAQSPEGAAIAGWFSAQPRALADITPFERYIHRKHFPERWQVALLIDSRARTSRLYRWQGERLVPCDNFYFWNATAEPFHSLAAAETVAAADTAPVDESYNAESYFAGDTPDRPPARKRRRALWLWAACLVLIYLLIPQAPGSIFWLQSRQARDADDLTRLEQELARLELEAVELSSLRDQPAAPEALWPGGASQGAAGSSSGGGSEAGENTGGATPPGPAASQGGRTSLESSASGADFSAGTYVIQPGDTMWAISNALFGDPLRFRMLADENQIEDPDRIFPGQRLRLPLSDPDAPKDPVPDTPKEEPIPRPAAE